MKSREFVATKLDVADFATQGAELQGQWLLADLERLISSVQAGGAQGHVTWHLRGEQRTPRGSKPQVWLHVEASAVVLLECQRCLGSVAESLSVSRAFLFVSDNDAAVAQLDAELEEDVLTLERFIDARSLVEDELLLALPLVPRHEVCPEPLLAPANPEVSDESAPHPFAALAALKRGGLPN